MSGTSTSTSAITTGRDGNLWFTDGASNSVGVMNPSTGAYTEFAFPTAVVNSITVGPDGNLWFTDGGEVGQINPTTDAITEYPIPYSGASGAGITAGPDGNLWFVDNGTGAIGVATLTTSQLVVTTQPPSSVTAGSSFGLTVTAENSSGNPITSFNGTVTVALDNNPGRATLGGTLSVAASQGVATFSGLTINKTGNGYTLQVSSSSLSSAVTSAINVTKTGKDIVLADGVGLSPADPLLGALVLDSPDFLDRLGLKKRTTR